MQLVSDVFGSPLDRVCVALDLETTGLDLNKEEIIEIGAVKFKGHEVLDTFETLVNPHRLLPDFIKELTGIAQPEVDGAPAFSEVADGLLEFLGDFPIVGHSIGFDLGFLNKAGLVLANPRYDTQELASVFLPNAKGYALTALAAALHISIDRPHRALEDARLSQQLYVNLVENALESSPELLGTMNSIAQRSSWAMNSLVQSIASNAVQKSDLNSTTLRPSGLVLGSLRERLFRPRMLPARRGFQPIQGEEIESLLSEDSVLAKAFPSYEFRPQQTEMAMAVALAFNEGSHLIAEAGTGVGKSLAYLLPSVILAARTGERIVISTNTINLQEQLIDKDLPQLTSALNNREGMEETLKGFKFSHLKGRSNYLCLRRWEQAIQHSNLSSDDARMACKVLVWLQETATGDRAEINIPARDYSLWDKISASDTGSCRIRDGVCFLGAAKARADAAQIVVVNHALLLSDLASGGGVIPEYDYLVIDEAHHLEEEASKQFGYEVNWRAVDDMAGMLGQQLQSIRVALDNYQGSQDRKERIQASTLDTESALQRMRERWSELSWGIAQFVRQYQENGDNNQLRLTRGVRNQPAWSNTEVQWENFDEILKETQRLGNQVMAAIEPLELESLRDTELELRNWFERSERLRRDVEQFVVQPDQQKVYWLTLIGQDDRPILNAAPLDVAPALNELLFSHKKSVVLTSATLSVGNSMEYFRERIGLPDAKELIVGSPFDYEKSTLLLSCPDMPNPTDPAYAQVLQDSLVRVAEAAGGGVLALFTSYSALRSMRRAIKPLLESKGIVVMAQGIDGTPRQLIEVAQMQRNVVLLGTASLWEGIDVPGENLRVVVVTRLPFNVPTEPVFAARSENFDNPFNQYAVPQAVLRFRQGFGRLIRTKNDSGVVLVLDSRIQSRGYGALFLRSLPPCTVRQAGLRQLGPEVAEWLGT